MAPKNSNGLKQAIQSVAGLFLEPTVPPRTVLTKLDYKTLKDVSTLPTGFRPVDRALGVGGLPYSHLIELVGPGITPISGGTTCIAARIASKVQRQQEIVTIIDMNQSFDPWQAERCGLVAPHLLLTRPDTVFEAITTMEKAARNAQLVVVVMGIVAELLVHVEPTLLQTLLLRIQKIVKNANSVFLFITHPCKNDPFHSKNYPAGFPLAEIADVRLWVQDEAWTYSNGLATAYKGNLTVIKNRLSMAGRGGDIRIKMIEL